MRDASGAGRDREDLGVAGGRDRLGRRLRGVGGLALRLGAVDDGAELLRRLGGAQGVRELLVHEELRQLGEHLEVGVVLRSAGAAIMNMRSAGASSGAFHSTPPGTAMVASPGRLTAEVLACGIAMPSPTAVENSASRARIAFLYATVSPMLPEAS